MTIKHVEHESYGAAAEILTERGFKPFGKLAIPASYRDMLAVYRMHGTDNTNPSRSLEYFYESKRIWVTAERRLQKLTLEQMVRMARANPKYYRVVVFDYAGRSIVLDAAQVHLRGEG